MMKTTLLAAMAATTQAADAACATATTGDKLPCVAPLRTTVGLDKIDYREEILSGTKGTDYRGRQNKTKSGKDCMAWNVQDPIKHTTTTKEYPQGGLEGNFCRNPATDNLDDTIWCFLAKGTGVNVSEPNRWEACEPLVRPTCKGTEDCYFEGYTGCCQQLTVTQDYKSTSETDEFGILDGITFAKAPVAGSIYTSCVSTEYVAEYEKKLAEGLTVKGSTFGGFLTKMLKADKAKFATQNITTMEQLYTAWKTDKPTTDAMTVEMTCLVSAEAKKDKEDKAAAVKKAEEDKAAADKAAADDAIMIGTSASVAFVAAALF